MEGGVRGGDQQAGQVGVLTKGFKFIFTRIDFDAFWHSTLEDGSTEKSRGDEKLTIVSFRYLQKKIRRENMT